MVAMTTKPTSQLAMRFPRRQESKEYTGRPFILSNMHTARSAAGIRIWPQLELSTHIINKNMN